MAKIKIPPKIFINNYIEEHKFYICLFRDIHHKTSKDRHYHIFIPVSRPKSLIVCVITSQKDNLIRIYRTNEKAMKSLITISRQEFRFLKEDSIINCNSAKLLNKIQLIQRIDAEKGIFVTKNDYEISDELKLNVVEGIKNSPLISPHIYKCIDFDPLL